MERKKGDFYNAIPFQILIIASLLLVSPVYLMNVESKVEGEVPYSVYNIHQNYNLTLEYPNKVHAKSGDQVIIDIIVINNGNVSDAPNFEIINREKLLKRDWKLSLAQNKHYFPPNQSEMHFLVVEIPKNEVSGSYYVDFDLSSRMQDHFTDEILSHHRIEIVVDGKLYYDVGPEVFIGSSIFLFILICLSSVFIIRIMKKHRSKRRDFSGYGWIEVRQANLAISVEMTQVGFTLPVYRRAEKMEGRT